MFRKLVNNSLTSKLFCYVFDVLSTLCGFVQHWVVPAGIPRVATRNSFYAEPAAAKDPKPVNRLVRVFRARGMKTARAAGNDHSEDPVIEGKGLLVDTDKKQYDAAHTLRVDGFTG